MPLSSIIVRISCCQLLMPAPRSDYGKKNCLFNYQMCVLCILDKKGCCMGYVVQIFLDQHLKQHFGCWLRLADKFGQPHPLQALCFSHRGIREM